MFFSVTIRTIPLYIFHGPTGHTIYFREVTFLDIAFSNIRQRAKEERDIRYLVTDEVRHYIVKNGLYRETASGLMKR